MPPIVGWLGFGDVCGALQKDRVSFVGNEFAIFRPFGQT